MEWFSNPQFLYLMGVLWIINGSILTQLSLVQGEVDYGYLVFIGVFVLGSWIIMYKHADSHCRSKFPMSKEEQVKEETILEILELQERQERKYQGAY